MDFQLGLCIVYTTDESNRLFCLQFLCCSSSVMRRIGIKNAEESGYHGLDIVLLQVVATSTTARSASLECSQAYNGCTLCRHKGERFRPSNGLLQISHTRKHRRRILACSSVSAFSTCTLIASETSLMRIRCRCAFGPQGLVTFTARYVHSDNHVPFY